MLIEASAIKGKLKCLVCKKEFQVATSGSKTKLKSKMPKEPSTASSGSLVMIFCPQCESTFGLPPVEARNMEKKCPKCGQQV